VTSWPRFNLSVLSFAQAAVVHETGPASALKIEAAWPVPVIVDGQVLVKNEFAGINFIDTYHRSGLYKRELPFVGGQEGGGVIAAVTPKVHMNENARAGILHTCTDSRTHAMYDYIHCPLHEEYTDILEPAYTRTAC